MRPLQPLVRRAAHARLASTLAVVALAGACVSFSGPDGNTDALSIARRGWAESGITAYEYTLARSCACPETRTRPVVVTVRNGAVVDRRYATDGSAVPASEAAFFPTMEGLFDEVGKLLGANPQAQRVFFNGSNGHPYSLFVDPRTSVDDDQQAWTITGLRSI